MSQWIAVATLGGSLVLLGPSSAAAEQPPAAAATVATPAPQPVPPAVPQMDLFDAIRKVMHKTPASLDVTVAAPPLMLTFLPTISSKPSTGVTIGALGNAAFFLGDPPSTGISTASVGANISTKKQVSITARVNVLTKEDRLNIQGDNRFLWTSQDTFGLGQDTQRSHAVNTKFDLVRVSDLGYRTLRKDLYAGLGIHINGGYNSRPAGDDAAWQSSEFVAYSQRHGFALDSQASNGMAISMLLDTRDSSINANKGWMAAATFRPYFTSLGSDSSWQEVVLDVRRYQGLSSSRRHSLAMWLYTDAVVSGVAPYFDLPATANDTYVRAGRGYTEGRYRGDKLAYGEVEYRGTLTKNGLIGMVAFLNATAVTNKDGGQKSFTSAAPAGGFGLRVLFNKRSKTNLCLDYGWGTQGSKGLYLGLQEVF